MKDDKRYIGSYRNEQQVLETIQALKKDGYQGSDIFIVSHTKEDLSMVHGRTDVEIEKINDGNLWDRLKAFLNGDAPIREAFEHMGISTQDAEAYATKAREGYILVFVDRALARKHAGDAVDLDGTGIGQRHPIKKDPDVAYETKVGAEATFERDRVIKDAELQREIKKTPRRLSDMDLTDDSGAGLVGEAHHRDEEDRSIKSPQRRKH